VVAPEGQNVVYVEDNVGGTGGVAQVLTETFAADTDYTLSVDIGNSNYYYWAGYNVQLLAGGTVIAEDNDTLWPDYMKWATSTVQYNYNVADAALVGQPLEIRLLYLGLDKDNPPAGELIGVEFDNVRLYAQSAGSSGALTFTLTLAVSDVINSEPVEDTMTIDMYGDACAAARIGKGLAAANPGDLDANCVTDFMDFALMATQWLDDASLTEPVAK